MRLHLVRPPLSRSANLPSSLLADIVYRIALCLHLEVFLLLDMLIQKCVLFDFSMSQHDEQH